MRDYSDGFEGLMECDPMLLEAEQWDAFKKWMKKQRKKITTWMRKHRVVFIQLGVGVVFAVLFYLFLSATLGTEFRYKKHIDPRKQQHVKDFYSTLGIKPTTNKEEIKKAYREQALKWHPDRNKSPEATKKMAEINAAYDFLTQVAA